MTQPCSQCGHANAPGFFRNPGVSRCDCCGAILPEGGESSAPRRGLDWAWIAGTVVLCVAGLLGGMARRAAQADRFTAGVKAELAAEDLSRRQANEAEDAARAAVAREQESRFQAMIADTNWLAGTKARAQHEEEWGRRAAHDRAFAKTPMEFNLLRMAELGRDPTINPVRALKEVALMAAPPKSRVEVVPFQDRYIVKVAFAHSAVAEGEWGGTTRHASTSSMRLAARSTSAGILREVFAACGSRGIEKLQVSYNHGLNISDIPEGATPEERARLATRWRVVNRRLYRVAVDQRRAAGVADWGTVSLPQVYEIMGVEHDSISGVQFLTSEMLPGADREPEGELEF
ncbi:MAG TPA: hypothetical protein DCM86_10065 [Verrucomicrobiales bacterium]|nr:hypothetical protein [Verrucomicrobiales bacterium]